jgi:hypothetical protein
MKIMIIPPESINHFWNQIEQYMQPVVEISFGEASIEGIKQRLEQGNMLTVACMAEGEDNTVIGCAVVAVSEFPDTNKRVLEIPYVGGERMHEWLADGMEVIRNIAKDLNCTHLRGCGRPGWERALPEFKKIRTVYECEV